MYRLIRNITVTEGISKEIVNNLIKKYVSSIFKKISPKRLDRTVYIHVYKWIHTQHAYYTHIHTSEHMTLLLPMVFEVLTTMEISGSTLKVNVPRPFKIFCTYLRK